MISVEEAFQRLVGKAEALTATEVVDLRSAYRRVLAEDLIATRTQPPFDASAMDGYAVQADDTSDPDGLLAVIGEAAAGTAFGGAVGRAEAVRIFTGAPVPAGADAVLIQENTEDAGGGRIRATEPVERGRNIRPAGIDFIAGQTLLPKNQRLDAGAIALAASGGHPRLKVLRRPKVAVVATGDELVLPGQAAGPSQIVASNNFGVAAIVEACGGQALDYGIATDEEAAISGLLDRAVCEEADVFVTIGGASVGDHDLVGSVYAAHGVELDFWKVAMRPGKPLMAGSLGAMRLVGLPGNPASSMVAATLFLAPLIRRLSGWPDRRMYRSGRLAADMPANDERADFVRAVIVPTGGNRPDLMPLGRQDSSLLSIYAGANALLMRPPHAPPAEAGDPCLYVELD